jgi:hypothetical protein
METENINKIIFNYVTIPRMTIIEPINNSNLIYPSKVIIILKFFIFSDFQPNTKGSL